jgi:hypothetical protein
MLRKFRFEETKLLVTHRRGDAETPTTAKIQIRERARLFLFDWKGRLDLRTIDGDKTNKCKSKGMSKKKKNKKYIPSPKFNPLTLSKKIEENKALIEQNRVVNEHKYRALEDFVGLLINFASHDIKNAVHSMDGMISTIDIKNLTQSDIDGLKLSMDNIR